MAGLTYETLLECVRPGGPSAMTLHTELAPAGGPETSIAPARFALRNERGGTYAYETRYVDGEARRVVIVDSKQSQLNRAEACLDQALADGVPALRGLPHITVTYERDGVAEALTDLRLPHRAYDGHIRAGTHDGDPVTQSTLYRAARNANALDARALLEFSPVTLVLGGWDASRRSRQGRWRSALVGEIIGIIANQDPRAPIEFRGGARVDPVAMQVQLTGSAMLGIAEAQRDELSPATFETVRKEADRAIKAKRPDSASRLGLGGIPPTLDQLGGVACSRIIRTHVLSFATLRQIRFSAGPDGDAACRALLAALALDGVTRSNAELYLRANCDLVEAGPTTCRIDRRGGTWEGVEPLDIAAADELLLAAIEGARSSAGIRWEGQTFAVAGNPAIVAGAMDAEPEEA